MNCCTLANSPDFCELLRPSEQAPVDGLCQDVTLNRFDHVGARLERVGRWFHVHLSVQRVELENVVVKRTVRGGSGPRYMGPVALI